MTKLSLSDTAHLLYTLSEEQKALYERSGEIYQAQLAAHKKFLKDMRAMSFEQEAINIKLAEVDKMISMAYTGHS